MLCYVFLGDLSFVYSVFTCIWYCFLLFFLIIIFFLVSVFLSIVLKREVYDIVGYIGHTFLLVAVVIIYRHYDVVNRKYGMIH